MKREERRSFVTRRTPVVCRLSILASSTDQSLVLSDRTNDPYLEVVDHVRAEDDMDHELARRGPLLVRERREDVARAVVVAHQLVEHAAVHILEKRRTLRGARRAEPQTKPNPTPTPNPNPTPNRSQPKPTEAKRSEAKRSEAKPNQTKPNQTERRAEDRRKPTQSKTARRGPPQNKATQTTCRRKPTRTKL